MIGFAHKTRTNATSGVALAIRFVSTPEAPVRRCTYKSDAAISSMKKHVERVIDGTTVVVALMTLALLGTTGWGKIVQPWLASQPLSSDEWNTLLRDGRRLGAANTPVTMVAFVDYECPVCQTVDVILEEALSEFPESFAVVYRHWPLPYHQAAYPAARAAECAALQGSFDRYHRSLFQDTSWQKDSTEFVAIARAVDVPDLGVFEECAAESGPVPTIEADIALAAAVGARGTPTLFINGEPIADLPTASWLAERIRRLSREAP